MCYKKRTNDVLSTNLTTEQGYNPTCQEHTCPPQGENRKKKTNLAEALQRVESMSQTQRMALKAEGARPREGKKMIARFPPPKSQSNSS